MSDEYSAPLQYALRAASRRLSFHMPGHKGDAALLPLELGMDLTELDVTDDLYMPTGPIAEAQRLWARSAGAGAAILLTNGSTCGVHAMLGFMRARGEKVILPRAVHKSAVNACALYGIEPVWVDALADESGAPYTPNEFIVEAMDRNPEAVGALVTCPDYYGRVCDISSLADAAHARGMLLCVDEAHGAHLNWARGDILRDSAGRPLPAERPVGAMSCGADMCVQSAHKTLCALTGSAVLCVADARCADELLGFVELTQSSSPSFLLMASTDMARAQMDAHGAAELARLCKLCDGLNEAVTDIRGLAPVRSYTELPVDATRLALDVSGRGITGYAALDALREMGLDAEMADPRRLVLIATVADDEASFAALLNALRRLPYGAEKYVPPIYRRYSAGIRRMQLREAALARRARLPLERAVGKVSARVVCLYPPGVPLLAPGEEITAEIAAEIEAALRLGARVLGAADGSIDTVLE